MNTQTAQSAEPSTLPRGIASLTLTYFLLILVDPALLWQLIGHLIAQRLNAAIPIATDQILLSSNTIFASSVFIGLATSFSFLICPLMLLDGRPTMAIDAFRKLCTALIIVHIALVSYLLTDLILADFKGTALMGPFAFVAIPATPLLYFVAKPLLTLRWLDLKAPPERWEKLIGIDGSGKKTIAERGGTPSSMALSLLVPPFACFRAKWVVRGIIASLLWLFGIVFLLINPLRAIPAFAAAAAIGRQVGFASLAKPDFTPPANASERLARLHRIFTPVRLQPPPRELATGLLAYLFMLPSLPLLFLVTLRSAAAPSAEALTQNTPLSIIMIPLLAIPLAIPSATFMPLGIRFGARWYQLTGALLIGQYLLLLGFAWHLTQWPFAVPSPSITPAFTLLRTILLLIAPLIIAIAVSLPRCTALPNIVKPPIKPGAESRSDSPRV
jgi:hypothetical protein